MRLMSVLLVVFVVSVSGQSSDSDREFELISIKPRGVTPVRGREVGPDVFLRPNANLYSLVSYAYSVIGAQIVGVPDWGRTEYWQVEAKAPSATSPEEMRGMVRRLLVDRFGLRTRLEARESDVYELVFANRDGRFGANVKPSKLDCEPIERSGKPRRMSASADNEAECAQKVQRMGATVTVHFRGYRVQRLAKYLEPDVQRVVIDRTNRPGLFDFAFTYLSPTITFTPTADTVPSLKTALKEQLGLELRSARAPVQVLVIESVLRPTPN